MAVEGIDVSHYQGDISWQDVSKAGKRFAFIKATEGTSEVDPMFEANIKGARAAGLVVGCYHFALLSEDAGQQAVHFCGVVGSAKEELLFSLDIEAGGLNESMSTAQVVKWVHGFSDEVTRETGRPPIIYCSPSFWEESVGNSQDFIGHPLWIARYTQATSPDPLPGGWKNWTFWQFSSEGTVPGIATKCDLDHYNGSERSLRKLTK